MRKAALGLLVAGVLALSMWLYVERVLIGHQVADAAQTGVPRGNLSDLYPRWLGSRELLQHRRDPYGPQVTHDIQVGYYGRALGTGLDPERNADPRDQQGFAYPVYVAFLLWPTLDLPFRTVQRGFAYLLLALTAASVPLWAYAIGWRPGALVLGAAVLLTVGSFPTLQGYELQQLSLLVGALLAGCAAALMRGWTVPAGVLLAVATIKPQVAAPMVAWLVLWAAGNWRQRQGLIWGFTASMAALLAGAEIVAPGWIGRFGTALAAYQQYTGGISLLDTLFTSLVGRILALALVAGLAWLAWRMRHAPAGTPGFALVLALVPAVTLLIIPTWAPYNQVLLVPGLLLLAARRAIIWPRGRTARYVYLMPWVLVGWPWLAALGLVLSIAVLPLATVQRGWTLPLYTSLFIPFGVLVALAYAARRNVRQAGEAAA
ncbi:MAG TPA: glycosyltransferase 87 family protein [Chloroflexia bacterium]|nr:glycosyltransferase 87 family protein [Chloroflexia bacterium]